MTTTQLAADSSARRCSQFPFAALRQAKVCMSEIADKCITDAVHATDQYSKWAIKERANDIRESISAIERLETDWVFIGRGKKPNEGAERRMRSGQ